MYGSTRKDVGAGVLPQRGDQVGERESLNVDGKDAAVVAQAATDPRSRTDSISDPPRVTQPPGLLVPYLACTHNEWTGRSREHHKSNCSAEVRPPRPEAVCCADPLTHNSQRHPHQAAPLRSSTSDRTCLLVLSLKTIPLGWCVGLRPPTEEPVLTHSAGNAVLAAITAIVSANIVLVAYIVVSICEERSALLVSPPSQQESKKDR